MPDMDRGARAGHTLAFVSVTAHRKQTENGFGQSDTGTRTAVTLTLARPGPEPTGPANAKGPP